MIAEQLIAESIPTVTWKESGSKVLALMEISRVSHLPVVENNTYFGVISDRAIYDMENLDDPIDTIVQPILLQPHVHVEQHIFEVAGVAMGCGVSVIPVLDQNHLYLGAITRTDVGMKMAELFSVAEPGGIIVLQLSEIDYSLSQIAQIIEGNDARILGLYLHKPSPSSRELNVSIKVNVVDLSGIIQTFVRYDYIIKATYLDQSQIKGLMDDRYDQFMRYINT